MTHPSRPSRPSRLHRRNLRRRRPAPRIRWQHLAGFFGSLGLLGLLLIRG